MIISGKNLYLKYIGIEDAQFVLKLRLNKTLNQFISRTDNDINGQIEWIKNYKKRELEKLEHYFLICNRSDNQKMGVVRVYNIENNTLEWGSWIIKRQYVNPMCALESILLIYKFIFENLDRTRLHFEVRKHNKAVNMFHEKYGAKVTSEDELNIYYTFDLIGYTAMKQKYKRYLL
jgi:RimJ/RimL family protein N-acetyltransferase